MKKVFKGIIILAIIAIILFVINYIRNNIIINEIFETQNNMDLGSNYYIKTSVDSQMENSYSELYVKDDICVEKSYINDKLEKIDWHNKATDEFKRLQENENGELKAVEVEKIDGVESFIEILLPFKEISLKNEVKKLNLFKVIKEIDGCYEIKIADNEYVLINKDSKVAVKFLKNEQYEIKVLLEINTVTEDEIEVAKSGS